MVFGILTAVAACPAIIGTTEAVRYGQKKNNREEHRGRKYHLTVTLAQRRSPYCPYFDGCPIVLHHNKLWVDTRKDGSAGDEYFPASTNYLPYPARQEIWKKAGYGRGEGFVTWINSDRFLNWVYVDKHTHEVKYGVKDEAEPHIVGPWDCTQIERRLTFQGWEGFIAVEEEDDDDLWAIYFDVADDGLSEDGQIGTKKRRMLELEVWRKEMRRELGDAVDERRERLEQREELGETVD